MVSSASRVLRFCCFSHINNFFLNNKNEILYLQVILWLSDSPNVQPIFLHMCVYAEDFQFRPRSTNPNLVQESHMDSLYTMIVSMANI